MRKLLFAIPLLMFAACGVNETNTDQKKDAKTIAESRKMNFYGDSSITVDGALEPKDFLEQMEGRDSLKTKLRATINETCKKKGCWMTVDMENGEQMHVWFKDYGFFVPTEGVEGKRAILDGYAFPDTVSVDDLRHIAEDAGKTADEIAAITEAEIGVNFEATGVIIEQ